MLMEWDRLSNQAIAAIEFNSIDRLFLLFEIAKYIKKKLYFWNPGYECLQLVDIDQESQQFSLT